MQKKYRIKGMTCSACQAHVQKAAGRVNGVKNANVNLVANTLIVEGDNIEDAAIMAAVSQVGYQASIYEELTYEKKANRKFVELMISLAFLVILLYVAMGSMLGLPLPNFLTGTDNAVYFVLAQIILLMPIVGLNFHYFTSGFKKLFRGHPNMDTLVAIGSAAAIIYGLAVFIIIIIATQSGDVETIHKYHMQLYLESAGTILTLVSVGKYIESRAKSKTGESLRLLLDIVGKEATIMENNQEKIVHVDDIALDDIIRLSAGSVAPVDGIIIEGDGHFNEATLTGESLPIFKTTNDIVKSGTHNLDGFILMKATSTSKDSTVAKIIAMVEEAGMSKAPIARLADKVSLIFVPIVLAIALITFVVWLLINKDLAAAFNYAVSVLVISCPCALGLATPIAIMIGTGVAAKNNILIKNAETLEGLSHINTVVFDKTGTITKGQFVLDKMETYSDEFLPFLYGLEAGSLHPLALAVNDYCQNHGIKIKKFSSLRTIPGKGIVGVFKEVSYYAGNYQMIKEYLPDIALDKLDATNIYLANEEGLLGYVTFKDEIKEDSEEAVKLFKMHNIKTIMLTGDNELAAQKIQNKLHLDEVIAGVLPNEKAQIIKDLEQRGEHVAMVGDGINDAVALEQATIGMAIGAGSDIAISSANVILSRSSLLDCYNAYALSLATMKNIKMNLFWAFFYNALGIPLAAGVLSFVGLTLTPMIASLAMSLSSVCVVLNALRLKNFKRKELKKMEKTIGVDGMMCANCAKHVQTALAKLDGVEKVEVDLKKKQVHLVMSKMVTDEEIRRAVEESGYQMR